MSQPGANIYYYRYYSLTLCRDFVDKLFAMCRWALRQKDALVEAKKREGSIIAIGTIVWPDRTHHTDTWNCCYFSTHKVGFGFGAAIMIMTQGHKKEWLNRDAWKRRKKRLWKHWVNIVEGQRGGRELNKLARNEVNYEGFDNFLCPGRFRFRVIFFFPTSNVDCMVGYGSGRHWNIRIKLGRSVPHKGSFARPDNLRVK